MSTGTPSSDDALPSTGQHLATVSHVGRFWDVYLEFEDDPRHMDRYRALLAYSAADRAEGEETLRTIPIIVEPSYEEAVHKARRLEDHQLVAFLRSMLP
ncbi:MAG: hypothetical protein EA421_05595 [Gemmatimonadales bacterium]|nr:MAG: hypothetical protein EA421_05595 [Gemmatimonadales bacterium]